VVLSSEAWLADVTSRVMSGCTAAVTSKIFDFLITIPHSLKKDCYEDTEATRQREKHLCGKTY